MRYYFIFSLLFFLVGCVPANSPHPPMGETPAFVSNVVRTEPVTVSTMPKPTSVLSSRKVIRVGVGESGDDLNVHQMVIQAYENSHPDVLVQMEAIAGTDYYARLMTLIDAGRAPDVISVGDDYVRFFVDKGLFSPLTDQNSDSAFGSGAYLPGLLEPGRVKGIQYFLPMDYSTLALYYNKRLFDAARLPYPNDNWDWNDLLAAARVLTIDRDQDGDPEQWGIQMNANWENGFEYWVSSAGGRLISEDGHEIRGNMDSPETERALQFYADLYHKYRVAPPPADLQAWAGGNREFENGTAAMVIFGRWKQADYLMNPNIDLGICAPPHDEKRVNILFWNGVGVSSLSEYPEQAAEFLKFYTGEGSAKIWGYSHLPVVRSGLNQITDIPSEFESVWIKELDYLYPRAYSFTPYWEETGRYALKEALTRVLLDPNVNIAAVLQEAAIDAQTALDQFVE